MLICKLNPHETFRLLLISVGQAIDQAKGSPSSPIRPKTTDSDGPDSDAGHRSGLNFRPR